MSARGREALSLAEEEVRASSFLRKLRRIEIVSRGAVQSQLAGGYHSVFKGRGMAFSEVRPYQPGDDVRAIDWNVTARSGDPFIKVFAEERELTALIAVDRSASQDAGQSRPSKAEAAAEVAGLLAFSALENGDRAGLALFTDRVERAIPPRKGRKHALRLLAEILRFAPHGKRTDLSAALGQISQLLPRRAVVFVVSDFLQPGEQWHRALSAFSRRHDVVPVVLTDPLEERLDALSRAGLYPAVDPETGMVELLDFGSRRTREAYAATARALQQERDQVFDRLALDAVRLHPGEDPSAPLAALFRARARRRTA